jgi:RNA polymerase-binding transcription factor DksA
MPESIESIDATLRDVERALDRLLNGEFRTCELCGAPIDVTLTEENPLRTNCAAHPSLDL